MAVTINSNGTITGIAVGGLPDGVVDTDTLAADAVTAAKVADDVVNSEHLVDGGVDNAHLASGVDAAKVTTGTLPIARLGNDVIDSQHYAAGSVDLEHMSSQSVDEDNLHISNAGTNGQFLSKQSGNTGGLTWADAGTTNSKFLAYPTAAANNNVTGTGTYFSWSSDAHTLVVNEGSAMGTSAGSAYYTAPETGWYIFTGQVFWYGHAPGTTTQWIFYLITTPRNFQVERRGHASDIAAGFMGQSWSVVTKLSSGDTAFPRFTGYGSAVNMDFWGGNLSYNWWSGSLLA
jgi:hypothetical protein